MLCNHHHSPNRLTVCFQQIHVQLTRFPRFGVYGNPSHHSVHAAGIMERASCYVPPLIAVSTLHFLTHHWSAGFWMTIPSMTVFASPSVISQATLHTGPPGRARPCQHACLKKKNITDHGLHIMDGCVARLYKEANLLRLMDSGSQLHDPWLHVMDLHGFTWIHMDLDWFAQQWRKLENGHVKGTLRSADLQKRIAVVCVPRRAPNHRSPNINRHVSHAGHHRHALHLDRWVQPEVDLRVEVAHPDEWSDDVELHNMHFFKYRGLKGVRCREAILAIF